MLERSLITITKREMDNGSKTNKKFKENKLNIIIIAIMTIIVKNT